jgi:hypothetical protein
MENITVKHVDEELFLLAERLSALPEHDFNSFVGLLGALENQDGQVISFGCPSKDPQNDKPH